MTYKEAITPEVMAKIQAEQPLTEAEQLRLIHAPSKVYYSDYSSDEEVNVAQSDYIDLLKQCVKYHQFDAAVEQQMLQDYVNCEGVYHSPFKDNFFADIKIWVHACYYLLNDYAKHHRFHPEVEVEFVNMYLDVRYGKRKGRSLREIFDTYCRHSMQLDGKIEFIKKANATDLWNLVNCEYFYIEAEAEAEFIRQRDRFSDEKVYIDDDSRSVHRSYYIPKKRFDDAFKLHLKKLREYPSHPTHLAQEALLDSGYTDLIEFYESYFNRKLIPMYRFEIDMLSQILRDIQRGHDWEKDFYKFIKKRLRPKTEQELLKPEYALLLPMYEAKWGPIKEG